MWIQVRSIDGKKTVRIDNLSKLTKIEELRDRLIEPFEASPERQRLFFRGKQLVDGHSLFDYNVGLNELIQLMVQPVLKIAPSENKSEERENGYASSEDESLSDKENKKPDSPVEEKPTSSSVKDIEGSVYKVGDFIDVRDTQMGAWFEASITAVKQKSSEPKQDCNSNVIVNGNDNSEGKMDSQNSTTDSAIENMDCDNEEKNSIKNTPQKNGVLQSIDLKNIDDGFEYHIVFEGYDENDPCIVSSKDIRPRAKTFIKFDDLTVGRKVMLNYNYDSPEERGYWYDGVITEKRNTRTIKELKATIYFGADLMPLNDCNILFLHEVMDVEKPGTQTNISDVVKDPSASPVKRQNKPECDHCMDNPRRKCRHCACCICGGKNDPDKQILCDECDKAYHMSCMNPPMETLPDDDEWYCPSCKLDSSVIVKAGEKLKESKKKSKMASATGSTNRDWGKGMACVGRTKVCSIVPSNHFGPIPGIEVGTAWKFRVQASEAGVHRPHVAGIHGREEDGAFSIVLSGGYEDDKDDGEKFTYTGSGGRDLSGNKRTAEQSCDQTLTRMNKALAKNCNAPINCKEGAEAKDWKNGKPVRVVRNCKGRKHSDYAPEEGNRYDGIYKVVKYWQSKGKSGFMVWRYLLRRDDETPAPWTKEGKKRIEKLGLTMQYPEGYLEAQEEKEKLKEEETPNKGKKKKRKADDMDSPPSSPEKVKKSKVAEYKIESPVKKLIDEDTENQKLWEEGLQQTSEGGQKFLAKIEELFMCICCQEIVYKPVTTSCSHNFCKSCIQRSFKAEVYTCPYCRTELGKDYKMPCNKTLSTILLKLFPGYDAGRT